MKETATTASPPPMSPETLERLRHESGVAVTREGLFTYLGRPIENERVAALFMRGLDVRDDGKVTLTVGRYVAYPEVETVARFVRRLSGDDAVLADERVVPLAGARIAYGPDDRFYVWLVGLRGPAVMLRDAHQAFAGRLADQEGEAPQLGWLASIPRADSPFPSEDEGLEPDQAVPRSRA